MSTEQLPAVNHALLIFALPELSVGDVVTYHGSIRAHHGDEFVITGNTGGRLRIRDRATQEISMSQVRRTSVHPTGDVVELCDDCHHIAEDAYGNGPSCRKVSCQCRKHGSNPDPTPAVSMAGRLLLLQINRTAKQAQEGVEKAAETLAKGHAHVDGTMQLHRASHAVRLSALFELASTLLRECPELGLTRDLTRAALLGSLDIEQFDN
ncbi:hypothetical protein [Nocardia miyunensis]|uniref:hypothetical protein n=1 Tax=Nocardia miyunensis TaxID=282684 RepID=UPI0008337CEC|nr:hypothetical protein [Nocardia miyunensis]